MKKIVTAIVVGIALISGVACGGSSWSKADKAELNQGLTAGVALGVFTQTQADCMSKWLQSHYDSMSAAQAEDNDKAGDALLSECKIDVDAIKAEFGG